MYPSLPQATVNGGLEEERLAALQRERRKKEQSLFPMNRPDVDRDVGIRGQTEE